MGYHLTGVVSALFVTLSLVGIAAQLRLVWQRKRDCRLGTLKHETPTSILSLNRFATSYFAFFAMFLYGLTLERFNHYLVWPRTIAISLLLMILFEIWNDRRDKKSFVVVCCGAAVLVVSVLLTLSEYRIVVHTVGLTHGLVVLTGLVFFQGACHQLKKIRNSGRTGALSLLMHQLFFLKDSSSLLFGLAMGFSYGWPVVAFHALSLVVQIVTMWHFRWVRLSPVAAEKRSRYKVM